MEFVPVVVMSSAVKKLVDTVKYLTNGDLNAVVTQLTAWLMGILMTWVGAASDLANSFQVNGVALGDLNAWSLILVGFVLASTAGVGWDVIKAVDASNSAIVPNLLGRVRVSQGEPGSAEPVD